MLSIETQILIDRLCDQAESEWKAGFQPKIAKLVDQVERSAVPILISELIRVDREINARNEAELKKYYLTELPSVYGDLVVRAIIGDIQISSFYGSQDSADLSEDFDPEEYLGVAMGNYRIDKILGVGGFGMVYRAKDRILNRHVVIKVPRGRIFGNDGKVDEFLEEARNIAQLRHANILNVLHVGKEGGQPYIVEEYFEQGDLGRYLQNAIPQQSYTLTFIKQLAEAIHYAHGSGIIHRDLKPANILIGINREPIVGDFGLSLHAAKISATARHVAGTVHYMSPEQIRGETHRLDGRADIWSIGVILYRMLTGSLPFDGKTTERVAKQVIFGRPKEPGELVDGLSDELSRICMRCLAQRVNDRYETAAELSEDLRRLVEHGDGQAKPFGNSPIRAKGLSSFGNEDRDFFLSLLPGPISRSGYPDCIDFWKKRIERPELSQPVGLILGPSGSGKSSMVHAGLIPSLNDQIEVVSVNATLADTEVRLLKGLRSKFPELPNDVSLPVAIAGLRERRWISEDRRLLIVLDQFEQWLHGNSGDEHPQLVHALRHCDGQSVSALILVREDFFMAVSKFFTRLEVDLIARKNFSSADLFSEDHAKNVLIKFGQGLGKLPARESDFSNEQNQFLDRSVTLISIDQTVICIRLAIFVEAIKKLPWTMETLEGFGESKVIGTYFLEQVLGDQCGNVRHRYLRQYLIKVLEELLPDPGVEIKGSLCSKQQLADATGLSVNSAEFKSVLRILDSELRFITPTDPDGEFALPGNERSGSYFQLTHDYLVPSLRDWLRCIRGQSRKGRAELRLQELAGSWSSTNDQRFMPGVFDYASIVWHVPARKRSKTEKSYLRTAGRLHGSRFVALAVICLMILGLFWRFNALKGRELTRNRVDQFVSSNALELGGIMVALRKDSATAIGALQAKLTEGRLPDFERRRVNIGLAMLGEINQARTIDLVNQIPVALDSECASFIEAFRDDPSAIDVLDRAIADTAELDDRARLVIVRGFLSHECLVSELELCSIPDARSSLIYEFAKWHGDLAGLEDWFVLRDELASANASHSHDNPGYLSGLCLCLSGVRPGEIRSEDMDRLSARIQHLYKTHPSSAVHGAARAALSAWGIELPKLNKTSNQDFNEWWVNDVGMTMVEYWAVDKGGRPSQLSISSCEITESLFFQFLSESVEGSSNIDPCQLSPSLVNVAESNRAVTGLNQHDAILFCNWLSDKHGLERCYRKIADSIKYENVRREINEIQLPQWDLVENATGYRLPNCDEWQLAACGGSETKYACSGSEFFPGHGDYEWNRINSKYTVQPVGQLKPNQLGIFDMLGNASEVCWGFEGLRFRREIQTLYSYRGGSAFDNTILHYVGYGRSVAKHRRHAFVGFRVVAKRPR